MSASDEFLTGRIALQLKLITPDQLAECVDLGQATKKPLGQILLEKRYLTQAQLDQVLAVRKQNLDAIDPATKRRREAVLFGKLAVREGYVPEDSVNECLRLQAQPGETRSIGEIMVERGYLTARQVHALLEKQVKRVMACPACKLSFTVLTLTEGKNVKCPRCKGPLQDARAASTVRTDAEFATQIMRAVNVGSPTPKPFKMPRKIDTACVICDTVFEGEIDSTGRMTCPACHTSFTPR